MFSHGRCKVFGFLLVFKLAQRFNNLVLQNEEILPTLIIVEYFIQALTYCEIATISFTPRKITSLLLYDQLGIGNLFLVMSLI